MCGFSALLGVAASAAERLAHGRAMLDAIAHRGPDEAGLMVEDWALLGTARLSIIDVAGGAQPLSDPEGRWWIAYNGEVFNYLELRPELEAQGWRFSTRTDTEVVLAGLALHGAAFVPRLNGQFGFCFVDRARRTAILARDRFGERPVFYTQAGGGIAAASEMKALTQAPGAALQLDPRALRQVARRWTAGPDATVFEGVRALPPGHVLEIGPKGAGAPRVYATTLLAPAPFAGSQAEAVEAVRETLTDATRLRLRSDVPVGCFVSGGLDSTIIAGLRRRIGAGDAPGFSLAFADANFDERGFQAEVAAALGLHPLVEEMDGPAIAAAFTDAVWHSETVQFRTAAAPMARLAARVRRAGVKVVLTGEGADEAFLGYNIFKDALARLALATGADEADAGLNALYPYLAHVRAGGAAMASYYRGLSADITDPLFGHAPRLAMGAMATRVFRVDACEDAGSIDAAQDARIVDYLRARHPDFDSAPLLRRVQAAEMALLLDGYLLSSQADRMMAGRGVEGRSPFLDPRVVDLAFQLPPALCLTAKGEEKRILKDAFADLIPEGVRARPKQPYRAPGAKAFCDGTRLRPEAAALLSPVSLEASGVLDVDFVTRLTERVAQAGGDVSPAMDQAFVCALSSVLLHQFYVARSRTPERWIARTPAPRIQDLTGRAVSAA